MILEAVERQCSDELRHALFQILGIKFWLNKRLNENVVCNDKMIENKTNVYHFKLPETTRIRIHNCSKFKFIRKILCPFKITLKYIQENNVANKTKTIINFN